jgi:antirestriction protein ArdC
VALSPYQTVTDRIVAMLEAGTPPWQRSWSVGQPTISGPIVRPLRACGKPYTGANVINLWAAGMMRGFRSRYWMTYKGAKEAGGNVRKGAKSELAFYVGKHTVEAKEPDQDDKTVSFMRAYCVFNCDEIEGLPARFYATEAPAPIEPAAPTHARNGEVDTFVSNLNASIAHGGDRAYYMPSMDAVRMPHLEQFDSAESYYATLLHELTHWTSHETRCPRPLGARFGDDAYAAEELVAELGAAFLCADLGVTNEPRADHASYIASWIRVLKADNRAIFRAASLAEKAATFMHGKQPASEAQDEAEAEPEAMAA